MPLPDHSRRRILKNAASMFALTLLFAAQPAKAAPDSTRVALDWLQLIDGGKYDDSWARASLLLQAQHTLDQWQSHLQHLRTAYGDLSTRGLASVSFSKSLAGFPDGSYATVRYQSSFFKQRDASETVSLHFEGGQWRPIVYTLR